MKLFFVIDFFFFHNFSDSSRDASPNILDQVRDVAIFKVYREPIIFYVVQVYSPTVAECQSYY